MTDPYQELNLGGMTDDEAAYHDVLADRYAIGDGFNYKDRFLMVRADTPARVWKLYKVEEGTKRYVMSLNISAIATTQQLLASLEGIWEREYGDEDDE